MYAELELKFRHPIDVDRAHAVISKNAGSNGVQPAVALLGTALASVPNIANAALVAEQIRNAATIIYFAEGNDTIKAHIDARSLAEVRVQCTRIARQLAAIAPGDRVDEARARVLVQVRGTDEALLEGQKVSFARRLMASARDKFIGKFLPAAVAFGLTARLLGGTNAVTSAEIAVVAAVVAGIVDACVAALQADEWKWKDAP